MGRPIKKSWFNDPAAPGYQLKITAKLPGQAAAEGYILEQTGTRKYKVSIGGVTGDVFLVNKSVAGNLVDGEAFILATPFGGSALPVSKLQQYRVSVFNGDGSFSQYSWDENAASVEGQATVISDSSVVPVQAVATYTVATGVITVSIVDAGEGYTSAPSVVSSEGAETAVFTATVSGGAVDSITTVDTSALADGTYNLVISAPE